MIPYLLKTNWWKWVTVVLLLYTFIGGLLFPVPELPILNETIRAIHFHVPMWFGMILLFLGSMVYAIKYMNTQRVEYDIYSSKLAFMGIIFGVLGLLTGMMWAKFTWGEIWSNDPKQTTSAIALLIYIAYAILRKSILDDRQMYKLSAVYNVFAFAVMIPLLFIVPRMTDSLHPGNGGNPAFNTYDLDSNLRKVFYIAVIGWTMLGYWVATVNIRLTYLKHKLLSR